MGNSDTLIVSFIDLLGERDFDARKYWLRLRDGGASLDAGDGRYIRFKGRPLFIKIANRTLLRVALLWQEPNAGDVLFDNPLQDSLFPDHAHGKSSKKNHAAVTIYCRLGPPTPHTYVAYPHESLKMPTPSPHPSRHHPHPPPLPLPPAKRICSKPPIPPAAD